jgi:hypothetical protein
MNERIRELATEVGISVEYLTNTKQIALIDKFAELIVRECHDVVFKKTGPKSALNILEHFGIEE